MNVVYVLLLIVAVALFWAVSLFRNTAHERSVLLGIGGISVIALGLSIAEIQRQWEALPEHSTPTPQPQPDMAAKVADLGAKLERVATAAEATRNAVEGIRDKLPEKPPPKPPNETCPPSPATAVALVALSIEDAGSARRLTPRLRPPARGQILSAGIKFCPAGAQESGCIDGLRTPDCPEDANLICKSSGRYATIPAEAANLPSKFCIRIALTLRDGRTENLIGGPIGLVAGATWSP